MSSHVFLHAMYHCKCCIEIAPFPISKLNDRWSLFRDLFSAFKYIIDKQMDFNLGLICHSDWDALLHSVGGSHTAVTSQPNLAIRHAKMTLKHWARGSVHVHHFQYIYPNRTHTPPIPFTHPVTPLVGLGNLCSLLVLDSLYPRI